MDVTAVDVAADAAVPDDKENLKAGAEGVDAAGVEACEVSSKGTEAGVIVVAAVETAALVAAADAAAVAIEDVEEGPNDKVKGLAAPVLEKAATVDAVEAVTAEAALPKPKEGWEADEAGVPKEKPDGAGDEAEVVVAAGDADEEAAVAGAELLENERPLPKGNEGVEEEEEEEEEDEDDGNKEGKDMAVVAEEEEEVANEGKDRAVAVEAGAEEAEAPNSGEAETGGAAAEEEEEEELAEEDPNPKRDGDEPDPKPGLGVEEAVDPNPKWEGDEPDPKRVAEGAADDEKEAMEEEKGLGAAAVADPENGIEAAGAIDEAAEELRNDEPKREGEAEDEDEIPKEKPVAADGAGEVNGEEGWEIADP